MAKSKQQKQKDREKRVAKQKLADAAKRRELQKQSDEKPTGQPRAKKVITEGVKQKSQVTSSKPNVTHRRAGGG